MTALGGRTKAQEDNLCSEAVRPRSLIGAPYAAILASQAGVTVFHVAFARWLEQDDPDALGPLMDEALG